MAGKKHISASSWATIAKAQDRFRFGVVSDTRKNLAIKATRTVASGNTVTAPIDSTGYLSNSLGSKRVNLRVTLYMEGYGWYVDQGRDPGSWPPVDAIKKWIKDKPLKLRDRKGRFTSEAKTPSALNSLAFLIGRAIDRYGIRATYFFTDPYVKRLKTLEAQLGPAIEKDLDIILYE